MIARDVMRDIRERDATAQRMARANDRRLSVAQLDRRDLIREVDRLAAEVARLTRHNTEAERLIATMSGVTE